MKRTLPAILLFLTVSVSHAAITIRQPNPDEIQRLQREIQGHEELFSQSSEKERSLLDELQQLDNRIDQQRKKIEELSGRIGEQEKVIAVKGQELREL